MTLAQLLDMPKRMKIGETIDCLNDIIFCILGLKGCIDNVLDWLEEERFDFIHFSVHVEELLNDWTDLMDVYAESEHYVSDLDFEFNHFVQTWRAVLTVIAGKSVEWCIQHRMLIRQFFFRLNEIEEKFVYELKILKRIEQRKRNEN